MHTPYVNRTTAGRCPAMAIFADSQMRQDAGHLGEAVVAIEPLRAVGEARLGATVGDSKNVSQNARVLN